MYAKTMADLSVTSRSSEHIPYTVLAVVVTVLFHILPTLLVMLYPIKLFRRLLSKCHLDFIAINILILLIRYMETTRMAWMVDEI